tara:strand:+ start:561 stop:1409 length:849 start_codon:yes stop_codon:yes gene_type:complete
MVNRNQIKVSILIPTFNRDRFINNAINSSLNQTFPCEVIVCDHGSTDRTQLICESYGDKINYIRRDIDYGIHFCELESILAAKGKYIHFCFDDDWMHPKFIETCINLMNENVGIVFSKHEVVNLFNAPQNKFEWDQDLNIKYQKIFSILWIPHVMQGLISPSAALVRKKDALQCMYMTTNLVTRNFYNGVGPDWLITAMPLFRYKNCVYISTPLIRFGDHEKSITMDALNSKDDEKLRKFRAAYTGARIYLLISSFIRFSRIEVIYFIIEELFRKIKRFRVW